MTLIPALFPRLPPIGVGGIGDVTAADQGHFDGRGGPLDGVDVVQPVVEGEFA